MRRGEIYMIDLGPEHGRELGGVRPVVVVSGDVYNLHPLVVIVIIGADSATVPSSAGVFVSAADSGARLDIVLFAYQVRALDPARFSGAAVGVVPSEPLALLIGKFKSYLELTE